MKELVGECSELYYKCIANQWVLMRCDAGKFDGVAAKCRPSFKIARCRELYNCKDNDNNVYPVAHKQHSDGADVFGLLGDVPAEPQALPVPVICAKGERFALSACSGEYRECSHNVFVERLCFGHKDVFNPRTLECDRFDAIFGMTSFVSQSNSSDCRVLAGTDDSITGDYLQ